jgi:GNAT superfamily N-acetyltransferase
MFTKEQYRGKGYAKMVLLLLEKWAKEEGYNFSFRNWFNKFLRFIFMKSLVIHVFLIMNLMKM